MLADGITKTENNLNLVKFPHFFIWVQTALASRQPVCLGRMDYKSIGEVIFLYI